MASLSFSSITDSSFCVSVVDLQTAYERNDRTIDWYLDNTHWGTSSLNAHASSSDIVWFTNLESDTHYSIDAVISYTDGDSVLTITLSGLCKTEKSASVRPDYFDWTAAKTSGGAFNLTALEWNGLTDNINAVRVYRGYSPYSFTTVSSGQSFTAAIYNEAVQAIKGIAGYGTYVYAVSKGDKVYASQLNTLVSELNAIP